MAPPALSVVAPAPRARGLRPSSSLDDALQDRVRQEPRRIAGDRILVLADRQAARRMVDQPASEHRILTGKIRQWRQRLPDETLGAIRSFLLHKPDAGPGQPHVGTL